MRDNNNSGPCDLAPKEPKMLNSFSSFATVEPSVFQVPKALHKLMDFAYWGPGFSITSQDTSEKSAWKSRRRMTLSSFWHILVFLKAKFEPIFYFFQKRLSADALMGVVYSSVSVIISLNSLPLFIIHLLSVRMKYFMGINELHTW